MLYLEESGRVLTTGGQLAIQIRGDSLSARLTDWLGISVTYPEAGHPQSGMAGGSPVRRRCGPHAGVCRVGCGGAEVQPPPVGRRPQASQPPRRLMISILGPVLRSAPSTQRRVGAGCGSNRRVLSDGGGPGFSAGRRDPGAGGRLGGPGGVRWSFLGFDATPCAGFYDGPERKRDRSSACPRRRLKPRPPPSPPPIEDTCGEPAKNLFIDEQAGSESSDHGAGPQAQSRRLGPGGARLAAATERARVLAGDPRRNLRSSTQQAISLCRRPQGSAGTAWSGLTLWPPWIAGRGRLLEVRPAT